MVQVKTVCNKEIILDDNWGEFLKSFKISVQNGYPVIYNYKIVNGKVFRNGGDVISRLIMGAIPGQIVDHKNRNPLDNRVENLRIVTIGQNTKNRGKPKNKKTSSIYKGVTWSTQNKSWMASITVEYKTIHVGQYKTQEEAACAYNLAAKKLHGDFCCLNNINPKDHGIEIENLIWKFENVKKAPRCKGVSYSKGKGKWLCYVWVNGKRKYYGSFPTEDSAIEASVKYNSLNN